MQVCTIETFYLVQNHVPNRREKIVRGKVLLIGQNLIKIKNHQLCDTFHKTRTP